MKKLLGAALVVLSMANLVNSIQQARDGIFKEAHAQVIAGMWMIEHRRPSFIVVCTGGENLSIGTSYFQNRKNCQLFYWLRDADTWKMIEETGPAPNSNVGASGEGVEYGRQ